MNTSTSQRSVRAIRRETKSFSASPGRPSAFQSSRRRASAPCALRSRAIAGEHCSKPASGDVPPPNFVLDTSPGKHQIVWRVGGLDTTQAETLLRALASQYGGDPAATDISRLLRLPGFTNRKCNEAFIVRVHHETDAVYHGQDFHVQEGSPESPRHLSDSQQGSRKIRQATAVNPRPIGPTQNGRWRVATSLTKSCSASPTTVRTTRRTRPTMRASRLSKRNSP